MAHSTSTNTVNRPGQPMPRMTDSMTPSQAGPGPSSFKLAALSANSFHLDSPPFTGTAGPPGSDSISSLSQDDALHGSNVGIQDASTNQLPNAGSSTNGADASGSSFNLDTPRVRLPIAPNHNPAGRTNSNTSASPGSSSAAQAAMTSRPNVDVPAWSLDGVQQVLDISAANTSEDVTLTQVREEDRTPSSEYVQHSSLSPPPFSSSGPGPFGTTTPGNYAAGSSQSVISTQQRALMNDVIQSRVPRRNREQSRPTFPQTSDLLASHVEDAGSSAAGEGGSEGLADHNGVYNGNADGDADADADDSMYPPDGEVDGDDRAFVLRSANGVLPKRMPLQAQTLEQYKFPRHRLPTRMRNETKIPLVIVACGSFSPPTYLHLRIFEMAKDQVIESGKYELLGGYYSPVSDYYKKEGLAKATHRVRMCELAVEKTSTWLMVDAWESLQGEYQRTAVVLDHFDDEINGGAEGGILTSDGSRRKVRIMLLAGGDLIQSMGEPGVWADVDLHHILGRYGCMIVERTGADVWSFLLSHDLLWRYRKNLKIVKQTIFNDISSSKVRLFVRRGQSIKYLLPNSVIHYIEAHKLYRLPKELDTEPPDADLQHF